MIPLGNPGTGKSPVTTPLVAEACRRGKKGRFLRATDLVSQLLEAREVQLLLLLKTRLARPGALVRDQLENSRPAGSIYF